MVPLRRAVSAGETAKLFSDGSVIVTGPLGATFSANGKTVAVNIPGPTVTITGHAFFRVVFSAGRSSFRTAR